MVDCHTHSYYSDDSNIAFGAGIEAALRAQLKGLIFTDHHEFDYPNKRYTLHMNFQEREKEFLKIKKEHPNLHVLLGVELGFRSDHLQEMDALVKLNKLDFVLMSVHVIDKQDISNARYFEGKDKKSVYTRYLQEVLSSVSQFQDYDAVGHIGYIRRYGPYTDTRLLYSDYQDLIDNILKTIIAQGKGIEVNSSGLRRGLNSPIPDFDIIARYFELGGTIITLGSDSHASNDIGKDFDVVRARLKSIGFKQATYFADRKPVFYEL